MCHGAAAKQKPDDERRTHVRSAVAPILFDPRKSSTGIIARKRDVFFFFFHVERDRRHVRFSCPSTRNGYNNNNNRPTCDELIVHTSRFAFLTVLFRVGKMSPGLR